jgi:hypothetical protein
LLETKVKPGGGRLPCWQPFEANEVFLLYTTTVMLRGWVHHTISCSFAQIEGRCSNERPHSAHLGFPLSKTLFFQEGSTRLILQRSKEEETATIHSSWFCQQWRPRILDLPHHTFHWSEYSSKCLLELKAMRIR